MRQKTALEMLKTGKNIFLTGQAGAGKTYILNQYIKYLRKHSIKVAITASTGIAATHMNGMTIHAWAGMGIKDSFEDDDFKRIKKHHLLVQRLTDTQVLIVDEISMLHAKQVDLLDEILRIIRKNSQPFGGVQVIFCGDFFQLPPIDKTGNDNKEKYAFMAKAWLGADFKICYLDEQHRQTNQDEIKKYGITLNQILNQIRAQEVSTFAIETLLNTKNNHIDDTCTRLYTHNANVDKINQNQLDDIDADEFTYEATCQGDTKLTDALKKGVKAPECLTLKVGARVMYVKNDPELDVYNGSIGTIVDFAPLMAYDFDDDIDAKDDTTPKYPVIRLNSGKTILAKPEEWVTENNNGEVLAYYSQVPLCLAWAITVHKSQGMTLDAAEIDLSRTFETGQGYVALSRLRNLDGLKLLGLNQRSLWLDNFVFRANQRLLELGKQHEKAFLEMDTKTIRQQQKSFIGYDDINDFQHSIKKSNKIKTLSDIIDNHNHHKKSKTSTINKTKELIEQGLTLESIAKTRSLTLDTIISHIRQLIQEEGHHNYYHLIDEQQYQDMFPIYKEIVERHETPKAYPIYQKFQKRYSQQRVLLALIILDSITDLGHYA